MKAKQVGSKLILTWEKDDEIKEGEIITIQLDEIKTATEEQTGFKTVTEYKRSRCTCIGRRGTIQKFGEEPKCINCGKSL